MSTNLLRFDGRVAVVTGAGGGLGRAYALFLAERGASVVVNDLGGSSRGEGQSHSAADVVVQEIVAKGGKAVANYDSVEDGDKIIQTALDAFGKIDVVINNAGILRDRSFLKITDQDWDLIHRVHLRGSFKVTRSAWGHMKQQGYGRVIMTASGAGVYGNFGQANYSAAKMGLIGLSNTLAVEGSKYGIHSNVIIPVAASRLTEGILPPEIFEKMKPETVAPVVAWLCHEDCEDNGGVFETAGGWIGKYRWQRSVGTSFSTVGKGFTVEDVRDSWNKAINMEDGTFPSSLQENISQLAESLANIPEIEDDADSSIDINVEKIMKNKFPSSRFIYTPKDTILYALGIGLNSCDDDFLKYVYEGNEEFSVLPTFGVIPAQLALVDSGVFSGKVAGLKLDLPKILHGEQYLELMKPLLPNDTLHSNINIVDVLDKGSGAVVLFNVDTFDKDGSLVMKNQFSLFIVGSGGFNGKRTSDKLIPMVLPPKSPPDAVMKSETTKEQPALYRLSGDWNPLHIDPNFAAIAGFSQPILHGLCSFGLATRHVLKAFANNDVTKFKAIKVRFTKPVLPGNILQTEMWRDGNRIIFQSKVLENSNTVVSGYVDLHEVAKIQEDNKQMNTKANELVSETLFKGIADHLANNPNLGKDINGCFEWTITKNGKEAAIWTVNMKLQPYGIIQGKSTNPKPDVMLTIDDEDMVAMTQKKLNPQKAYMSGKIKIKGDIMLMQKLQKLFQTGAKL